MKTTQHNHRGSIMWREMSPRSKARLAGALFLATVVLGILGQAFLSERIAIAFSVYMIEMACQLALVAMMYELLTPVNRSVARVAAIFGLVGCGIKIMSRLFFYAPLLVLGGTEKLSAFDASQLDALAYLFTRMNDAGTGMALIFFGFNTVLEGYLIFRSTFLPRILGVLGIVSGVALLAYVYPPFGNDMFAIIALIVLAGAVANIGWLLIRGVDEDKWYETAAACEGRAW